MDTVQIKFNFITEELGYLGLASDYVNLKWNDFFNEAVQERIDWVFDPEEQEEVERIVGESWQELYIKTWDEAPKKPTVLTLRFPVEKLKSLHRAAEKLQIPVDVFVGDAVLDKMECIEDRVMFPEIFEEELIIENKTKR